MPGYPDSWRAYSTTNVAPSINASIALPAIPNVCHVITDLIASATWLAGAASSPFAVGLYISGVVEKWLIFTALGGSVSSGGQWPWSGKLILPPGVGGSLQWQQGQANTYMWLEAGGYMV